MLMKIIPIQGKKNSNFYFLCKNFFFCSPNFTALKIMEKIRENNPNAVLFMVIFICFIV